MYADDGKPYQSFSYVNGPGYLKHRTVSGDLGQEILRKDISEFTAEEMSRFMIMLKNNII